ncbi:MAG: hypothetical protein KR126chlam5_01566 [Candidatus Anoxychlamydiales bacterium]|nr:hypothetical protein [Candidatus Anoxychlamydiales bacterium]
MDNIINQLKKNLDESIYQKLKNLSKSRKRPYDEILRYYAIERFFLKGGLMLKVWDSMDHRATMDIDLLARTSNQIKNIKHIITDVGAICCEEDAINF